MSQKNLSKFKENLFFLLIFAFFVLYIFSFGLLDIEEYYQSYFNTKLFFNNLNIFFETYLDLTGLGYDYPAGFSFFLHPAIFFINNIKIFTVVFLFINFYIKIYFLKRIFAFFKIEFNIIITYLSIFSLISYAYLPFYNLYIGHTLLYPIIFYLFKFINNENYLSFLKLIFILIFQYINSHHGEIFYQYLGLFIIIILSGKNKLILNKKYLIPTLLLILSFTESIYWYANYFNINLLIIYLLIFTVFYGASKINININKIYKISFIFLKKSFIFFLILNSLAVILVLKIYFPDLFFQRLLYYSDSIPLYNFLGHFISFSSDFFRSGFFFLFFNILTIFFILFQNKKLLKIKDSIFIVIFIVTLLILNILLIPKYAQIKILPTESNATFLIEFLYIFLIIIFFKFFKDLLKNKIILFFIIISPIIYYFNQASLNKKFYQPNYLNNNSQLIDLKNYFSDLDDSNNRILLSKKLEIPNALNYHGIYAPTDYLQFNLSPVNTFCKKCNLYKFLNQKGNTFGATFGRTFFDDDITNNQNFYNFFQIKYLLFLTSEKEKFNQVDFKIIKKIDIKYLNWTKNIVTNDELNVAEINQHNFLLILDDNKKALNTLSACKTLYCIINNKHLKRSSDIKLHRNKLNNFTYFNNSNQDVYTMLPFNDVKGLWKTKEKNDIQSNTFRIVIIKKNSSLNIFYEDKITLILRALSYISILLSLLYILVFRKIFFLNNFKNILKNL